MQREPRIGDNAELSFRVGPEHAIDFANDEMPAVLSTPWLVWFLEHAARKAVLPCLEPGESTVGVHVDVEHLAPTPLGQAVSCRARVINTDRGLITFQVEAHDETERIARGLHKLRIIRCDRFAARVRGKAS